MKQKFHLVKSGDMVRTYIAKGMLDADGKQIKRLIKWDSKKNKLEEEIPTDLPIFNSFAEAKEQLCDCVIRDVSHKYTLADNLGDLTAEQITCLKEFINKFQKQKSTLCVVSRKDTNVPYVCELDSQNGHCRFIEPVLTASEEQLVNSLEKKGISREKAIAEMANTAIEAYKSAFFDIATKAVSERMQNNVALPSGDISALFEDETPTAPKTSSRKKK